jgi:hypothetical protein
VATMGLGGYANSIETATINLKDDEDEDEAEEARVPLAAAFAS